MQERTAVNRGLDGTFNSAITKLILHNHGYSDKQAIDHASTDGTMTPTFASMYGKPQPSE